MKPRLIQALANSGKQVFEAAPVTSKLSAVADFWVDEDAAGEVTFVWTHCDQCDYNQCGCVDLADIQP